MKYQDLKVRDAGRLAAIGIACAAAAMLAVLCRSSVESFADHRYLGLVGGLAVSSLLCLGGSAWYLFTSPAQNARFVEPSIRKRAKGAPAELDTALFDANDPSYRITTIAYLLKRTARQSAD